MEEYFQPIASAFHQKGLRPCHLEIVFYRVVFIHNSSLSVVDYIMVKNSRSSVVGKVFSQELLPQDLKGISCGQTFVWKQLIYLTLTSIIILTGFFSGLFAAYSSRIPFISSSDQPLTFSALLLIVLLILSLSWIWNCVYRGFNSALLRLYLLSLFLIPTAGIMTKNPQISFYFSVFLFCWLSAVLHLLCLFVYFFYFLLAMY